MEKTPYELMQKCSLFKEIEPDVLKTLSQACRAKRLKRGEVLFEAGHRALFIYVILSGSAKLMRTNPDGKVRLVHLLLKDEMFGAAVAMQDSFYPVAAIALEQTLFLEIEAKAFQTLFLTHPKLGQLLVGQMGQRIRQAHDDRINAFDSVEKRVAAFLIELLERIQNQMGKTIRIPVPLTRQDIADRVGSTVETIIRILSSWSKDNLIVTVDKYIEIPSVKNLQSHVGLEENS